MISVLILLYCFYIIIVFIIKNCYFSESVLFQRQGIEIFYIIGRKSFGSCYSRVSNIILNVVEPSVYNFMILVRWAGVISRSHSKSP